MAVFFAASSIAAAIPRTITYQGVLTDSAGNPISGEKALTFALLNGADSVWGDHAIHGDSTKASYLCLGPSRLGVGIAAPSTKLHVIGTVTASNIDAPNASSSDIRLKENIDTLDNVLDKLDHIAGISHTWKQGVHPYKQFAEGRQIGMVAQNVEQQFPELVQEDSEGYKTLSYEKMTAVLVQAVKELREENRQLRRELEEMRDQWK